MVGVRLVDLTPRATASWLCAVGAALTSAGLATVAILGGIDRTPGLFLAAGMVVACLVNAGGAVVAVGPRRTLGAAWWLCRAPSARVFIVVGGLGSLNFLVVGLALRSVSGAVVGVLQDLWPLSMLAFMWLVPVFRVLRPPGAVGVGFSLALVAAALGAALVVSAQFGGVAWADFAFLGVTLAVLAGLIVSLQFLCNMSLVRALASYAVGVGPLGAVPGWRRELLAQSLATIPTRAVAAVAGLAFAWAEGESMVAAQWPWALAMGVGYAASGYCHRLALRLAPDLRVVVVHYLSPVMTVGWMGLAGVAGIPLDSAALWLGIGLIIVANAFGVPRPRRR